MIYEDKNQSWTPPEGMPLFKVCIDGSFLLLEYRLDLEEIGWTNRFNQTTVIVNDQGREVGRVLGKYGDRVPPQPPAPVDRRWQSMLLNGVYLILAGFEEIISCLSGSSTIREK